MFEEIAILLLYKIFSQNPWLAYRRYSGNFVEWLDKQIVYLSNLLHHTSRREEYKPTENKFECTGSLYILVRLQK